jgi:hypothetical protein
MTAAQRSRFVLIASAILWAVYGVLSAMGEWMVVVGIGLIGSVALVGFVAIHKTTVKLMDLTMLGYFVLAAAAIFVIRSTLFTRYSVLLIWLTYALVTWASIIAGAPFSLQYARESTPLEHWHNPGFLRANYIITCVWGLAFAVNIGFGWLGSRPGAPLWVAVGPPILTMVGAALFTNRYTQRLRQAADAA